MKIFSDPYDFESMHGLKSIELWCADLTDFPQLIDVLVVSAYKNNYVPVEKSLIGALLNKKEIDVSRLAENPEIDLRNSQNVWLSRELDVEKYHIRRIACVELTNIDNRSISLTDIQRTMTSLFGMFAAAQYENIPLEVIAMPVLGAGIQKVSIKDTLRVLVTEGKRGLENIRDISKLLVVDRDLKKMTAMSAAMSEYLGRTALEIAYLPLDDYIKQLVNNVVKDLSRIIILCQQEDNKVVNYNIMFDLLNKLKHIETCKGFELSVQCRRILEVICCDLAKNSKVKIRNMPNYLAGKIDVLADTYEMAEWIKSYFHLLRILGNTSAHDSRNRKKPEVPEINDLRILVHCLAIVIAYWKNIKTGRV